MDKGLNRWTLAFTARYVRRYKNRPERNRFRFAMAGTGRYMIDWGDGTVERGERMPETLEGGDCGHTYRRRGRYRIRIVGEEGELWQFGCGGRRKKKNYDGQCSTDSAGTGRRKAGT